MTEPSFSALHVTQRDGICSVVLSAPEKKNALSAVMIDELVRALDGFQQASDARVLVLSGAEHTFCAGADLKLLQEEDSLSKGAFPTLLERFTTLGKPTIAKVEGYAMGGGMGLVASCDFAIASDRAVFGTPEVRRGFFPMMIMAVLSRVVPRRTLLRWMLLGERLSAQEVLRAGLIGEVVSDDQLDARVLELARMLSAQSPTAMRLGLQAFHRQDGLQLPDALVGLQRDLAALIASPDGQEGIRAFVEKREPVWSNR